MNSRSTITLALVALWLAARPACAAPQAGSPPELPMPYEYKYDVEDAEKSLFFGANESGDAAGNVVGGYHVWLPDGRLMTVEYTVQGESGFVPKISYQANAQPIGG